MMKAIWIDLGTCWISIADDDDFDDDADDDDDDDDGDEEGGPKWSGDMEAHQLAD